MRQAVGLTQTVLAQAAGLSRATVRRWEQRAVIDRRQRTFTRLLDVLMPPGRARLRGTIAHARGDGLLYNLQQRVLSACWLAQEQEERATNGLVLCGARTRKGRPCRNMSEPGRSRRKFHGGMSTGPRTPEGRERIAEAQHLRWRSWRAANSIATVSTDQVASLESAIPAPSQRMKADLAMISRHPVLYDPWRA